MHSCPYGFTTSTCLSTTTAVINANFDGDFQGSYDIFITATSSSSFRFWTNFEAEDPIPAYKRGLYFTSGKYLESNVDVYLSHTFSLGFWVKVISGGDILGKGTYLSITNTGQVKLALTSPTGSTLGIQTSPLTLSGWVYLSMSVIYLPGSNTLTAYKNNNAETSVTSSNYIFRDAIGNKITLGKSSTSSFTGFLYNFKL